MQQTPNDAKVINDYFQQVRHLSEIIVKSYRISSMEDAIQDLIEYSIKKRIYEHIKPEQNAFSYFWKSLAQHAWQINTRFYKPTVVHFFDMWEDSMSDNGQSEEILMERLDWSLEDYNITVGDTFLSSMEEVVLTRGSRGRPKTKAEGEKATHWEHLFKTLKIKGTMTESSLIGKLPLDKQKGLKNAQKSVEYYMRQIARREGISLSVSNNGTDTIYMVVNND